MIGWHHQLNGHEFEQAPGDGEGQGSLVCSSPWGQKESEMTERLINNKDSRNTLSHSFGGQMSKITASAGLCALRRFQGRFLPRLFLVSSSWWQSLSLCGLQLHHSHLCLHIHMHSSCLCVQILSCHQDSSQWTITHLNPI